MIREILRVRRFVSPGNLRLFLRCRWHRMPWRRARVVAWGWWGPCGRCGVRASLMPFGPRFRWVCARCAGVVGEPNPQVEMSSRLWAGRWFSGEGPDRPDTQQ